MSARYVPARIPIVDVRTGMMSREWYLFFQGMMDPDGGSDEDASILVAGASFAFVADPVADDLPGAQPAQAQAEPDDDLRATAQPADVDDPLLMPSYPTGVDLTELLAVLGYTPANVAGDTFTGAIKMRSQRRIQAESFAASFLDMDDGVQGIVLATSGGIIISAGAKLTLQAATLLAPGLPTYATDAAAGAGGLAVNTVYKTATGELRIKV